jgi:Tol biopolymer transport system component
VVAAASETNDGIALLSVETGERKMIAKPPGGIGYTLPAFSPDGKWLAFVYWRSAFSSQALVQRIGYFLYLTTSR